MTNARPQTMRVFLDWLARTHGSAVDLPLDAGLEPDALNALHERFVDRAAA